jgi:hypothetical protein
MDLRLWFQGLIQFVIGHRIQFLENFVPLLLFEMRGILKSFEAFQKNYLLKSDLIFFTHRYGEQFSLPLKFNSCFQYVFQKYSDVFAHIHF